MSHVLSLRLDGRVSQRVMIVVLVLTLVNEALSRGAHIPTKPHRDVKTAQGVVRGYEYEDPPHFAYYGIPYGRPPTRRDRFQPARPPRSWDGIYEATHRIKCVQPSGDGTSNCLVLNVFAPDTTKSLPVMVHIHGGGFQMGWGSFKTPKRLLREEIVVVTINYRLGPLGFLSLGTSEISGNVGLKDQIAALYWIQKNIAQFKGNAKEVTVYGTGSGAASVELLLFSGLTKGLLHKVILESGSALSPLSMNYFPLSLAFNAAKHLGYIGEFDTNHLESFYKIISTKKLMTTNASFLPCIDNTAFRSSGLLDKDPLLTLIEGKYHKVPMVITFTNTDLPLFKHDIDRFGSKVENFAYLLPNNLEFPDESTKFLIGRMVKEFYLDRDVGEDNIAQVIVEYFGDVITSYPVVRSALLHSKATSPVYLMEFLYQSGVSGYQITESMASREFVDIYNIIFSDVPIKTNMENIAQTLVAMWSNFIKIGDPTPITDRNIPLLWKSLNEHGSDSISSAACLFMDQEPTMSIPIASNRLAFWDAIYKKFYRIHAPLNDSLSDYF